MAGAGSKKLTCPPNMRTDVPMEMFAGVLIPDHKTAPNFRVKGTEFFIRDHAFGYVQYPLPDGTLVDYAVMPLFMCDLKDKKTIHPIITVFSAYDPDHPLGGSQENANKIWLIGGMARWRRDMKITAIVVGDTHLDSRGPLQDPLVALTYANNSDMEERFRRFVEGDFGALSKPGIVLLNEIATISGHWYE
jgi:hypothetical protein